MFVKHKRPPLAGSVPTVLFYFIEVPLTSWKIESFTQQGQELAPTAL